MVRLNKKLDPALTGNDAEKLNSDLRKRIVGQEEAVEQIVNIYQTFLSGMTSPGRPIGSPPGYLGHRETHPLLSQEVLNQYHTDRLKVSFVLFDEIEKASDALWNLRKFTPEFMNRIDKTVVFRPLGCDELHRTLNVEGNRPHRRILHSARRSLFASHVMAGAKDDLLREGADMKYGARRLKRAINRGLAPPVSNLVASNQFHGGDRIAARGPATEGAGNPHPDFFRLQSDG